jgi:hypothetical protein
MARFQRGLELLEIGRRHAQLDAGCVRLEIREQLRQQPHEAGVDDAEAEGACRRRGIERPVPRAQHRRVVEQGVHGPGELEGLGRRLHLVTGAHEQRVREVAAQFRERLTQGRLGDAEHRCGAREVALA